MAGYQKLGIIASVILVVCIAAALELRKHTELFNGQNILTPDNFSCYLINLKRKPERLKNFKAAYRSTDLAPYPIQVVQAVDGQKIEVERYMSDSAYQEMNDTMKRGYRIKHNQLTPGGVGCYLSHLKVLKEFVKSNKEYGLIFEDDIRFDVPNMYAAINNILSQVPHDWDIVLLGCICNKCVRHPHYKEAFHFFLTHAYIVRRSGALKAIELLEFKPISQQIDSELSLLTQRGDLRIYCLSRSLASQDTRVNQTTIQMPLKQVAGIDPYKLT